MRLGKPFVLCTLLLLASCGERRTRPGALFENEDGERKRLKLEGPTKERMDALKKAGWRRTGTIVTRRRP